MKKVIKYYNIIVSLIYVWVGFICAISFMEAWIKFQAEGVTTSIGVAIGRLVFNALNKVEILLSSIIILLLFLALNKTKKVLIMAFIPIIILLIQTFFLLPRLDQRAQLIINGEQIVNSSLHFYYVALEVAKLLSLLIFGAQIFKQIKTIK